MEVKFWTEIYAVIIFNRGHLLLHFRGLTANNLIALLAILSIKVNWPVIWSKQFFNIYIILAHMSYDR